MQIDAAGGGSQSLLSSIDPSGEQHGGLMRKILETSKALASNQAAAALADTTATSTNNDPNLVSLQSNRFKERAVLKQQVKFGSLL